MAFEKLVPARFTVKPGVCRRVASSWVNSATPAVQAARPSARSPAGYRCILFLTTRASSLRKHLVLRELDARYSFFLR